MPSRKLRNMFDAVNYMLHSEEVTMPADLRKELKDVLARGATTETHAAQWRESGECDPHGTQYDCERHQLPHGELSDDELANAFYLYDHRGGLSSMHWLQSAKDRIRWLSRKLVKAQEEIAELKELLAMKNTMGSTKDNDRLAQLRVQAADFSEFVEIPGHREIHVFENGRVYLVTNTNEPYEAGEYPRGGFVIERAQDVNRKTVRIRDDAVWAYIDHSPSMEQVNHFLRASARAERVKGEISGL